MKMLVGAVLAISTFIGIALALDSQYKTRIITTATLTLHVKEGQYIVIRNFTQDQDVGQRGVIVAGTVPSTPTPSPTPTPTPTPTCSPTPCPTTPTPTPTPAVPTPTSLFTRVLTASFRNGVPRVYSDPIIIPGPATLTIDPTPPASLSITYRKGLQPIHPSSTATAASDSSTSTSTSTTLSSGTS